MWFTVGGDGAALAGLAAYHVPDDRPGAGPLGGILTALRALDEDVVFVAACDLVRPDAGAVVATVVALGARTDADVAVPVLDDEAPPGAVAAPSGAADGDPEFDAGPPGAATGRPAPRVGQWLHGAWRRRTRTPLEARFAAGERAVHRAVRSAGLAVVEVEDVAAPTLADVDRPGDLPS